MVFALFQVYLISLCFDYNLIFACVRCSPNTSCYATLSKLQHYLLSLIVMTGCATNKVLHFPPSLLLLLRHTNTSLSKSMNMMLLLMLVAMKNQIMKHLLGSRTNQPIEKINIMSPLRSSPHLPKLGRNSTMSEPLKKLHQ